MKLFLCSVAVIIVSVAAMVFYSLFLLVTVELILFVSDNVPPRVYKFFDRWTK